MKKPESPCLECNNRSASCHATCDLYKELCSIQGVYNNVCRDNKGSENHVLRNKKWGTKK